MITMTLTLLLSLILLPLPSELTALASRDLYNLKFVLNMFTYQVDHANIWHLMQNFMLMAPFGFYLEFKIGWKNTLGLYFLSGFGAALGYMTSMWDEPTWSLIGSSGAAFGVFGAACVCFGVSQWKRLLARGWLFAALLMQFHLMAYGSPSVAYLAHVGGAVAGVLLLSLLSRPLARLGR